MTSPPIGRRQALSLSAALLAGAGARSALAQAPQRKRLIGVIEEDPPFFNLAISSGISSFVASAPVYSALTRMDINGVITGDLAESWDISEDKRTYVFHLRPGVTWHDGTPFSSADVKFSLSEMNGKLHPYRGALKAITTFETPDANTIIFRLGQPQGSLIKTLHNYCGAILPRHLWEGKGEAMRNPHNLRPIGTGPFKFAEFLPGDQIRYVKNEAYFLPGRPAFDELILRIMPDAAARMAAFQKGEIDMIYASALPATEVARLRRARGVELKFSKVQTAAFQAYINLREKPFSDVRVRQAVAHAVDRTFIRNSIFPGLATNMVGPVPPNSPLHNKALADYPLDPTRANALLDEAGFPRGPDGMRFPLRYLFGSNDLVSRKIGEIITQNLAPVGIRVVLMPLDRGALLERAYVQNQFDMVISSFALGPDPDVGVERFFNSNNISPTLGTNNSPYVNPEVDRLFDEQRVLTDEAQRKSIYDRIQEIVWRDLPVFPFCGYDLPGAARGSYVRGAFERADASNRDDFAFAEPAS